MKFHTTKKAITDGYYYKIRIGYCDLQYLLHFMEPIAYTSGVYGWNANIYQIENNVCIVTGYRPFGNISPNYERNRHFEQCAEKIVNDYKRPYEERKTELDKMIKELVELYIQDYKAENN